MRTAASFLASFALVALVQLPLHAQRADSALVGHWSGRVELTAPIAQQRELGMQLDIQDDGVVTGRIGDALLADAHLYRDLRVKQVLRLGRQFAIDGHLVGPVIRRESVSRELVHLSLDRQGDRLTGYLQTSGAFEGEPGDRMLSGNVSLARVAAPVVRRGAPSVELAGESHASASHHSP